MKNIVHIMFIIGIALYSINCTAQRDVLFCGEGSPTSDSWGGVKDDLRGLGYDFPVLIDPTKYKDALSLGVLACADHIGDRIDLRNVTNALAIGHDASGISLRYAQLQRPEISAMVLDGVPNQGSEAIRNSLPNAVGGTSKTQRMINNAKSLQGADGGCPETCNLTGLFSDWVTEINNGKQLYKDVEKESDIITEINETGNLPTVPYIVLYGTIENFSLARMMDSRGSFGNSNALQNCYDTQMREAIESANRKVSSAALFATGIFSRILGSLGKVISDIVPDPSGDGNSIPIGTLISETGKLINGIRGDIEQRIRQIEERDAELRRIIRCQAANQLLEAEWMLASLDGNFEEAEQPVPCNYYDECMLECGIDQAWGDGPGIPCDDHCAHLRDLECGTETVMVFIPEKTDGLLSESEQKLAGNQLVQELNLPDTDHFQETKNAQQVVMTTLQDIFDGVYGQEFVVPK